MNIENLQTRHVRIFNSSIKQSVMIVYEQGGYCKYGVAFINSPEEKQGSRAIAIDNFNNNENLCVISSGNIVYSILTDIYNVMPSPVWFGEFYEEYLNRFTKDIDITLKEFKIQYVRLSKDLMLHTGCNAITVVSKINKPTGTLSYGVSFLNKNDVFNKKIGVSNAIANYHSVLPTGKQSFSAYSGTSIERILEEIKHRYVHWSVNWPTWVTNFVRKVLNEIKYKSEFDSDKEMLKMCLDRIYTRCN
jgi:hypothetical protein